MNETQKQIARTKRIESAKNIYWTEVRKIESQMYAKIKKDKIAEKNLLVRCKKALYKKLEDEHTCKCCSVKYPDDMYFTEEGKLWVRYDADHPNDIIDYEYNIDELLNTL